MTQQLSFGLSEGSEATDYLFFCVFPESPIPANLTGVAQALRSQHGLTGKPLAPERFHLSLFGLGHSRGLNPGKVRQAKEAAATVKASAFDVVFDSVMSFAGARGNLPLVLRMPADTGPLLEFHKLLGTALSRAGLYSRAQFTPHITLLYDPKSVALEKIKPVHFKVNRFTLVHSLQGETKHVTLAQWNLQE